MNARTRTMNSRRKSFRRPANARLSFESLEPRAMLAADPGWAFALPGPAFDAKTVVNIGPDGFVYAAGGFSGTVDFDPGPGVVERTARTDANDNFVAKYTSQGALVWVSQFGGVRNDFNEALEFDAAGNLYLVGSSISSTVQFGTISATTQGSFDIYAAKVDATSGNFLWARVFGGTDTDTPVGAAVSPTGDVYVTGHFRGTADFDPSPSSTFNLVAQPGIGAADAFVAKLTSNGDFAWARQFSSPYDEFGQRIALDATGGVYAVGTFRNTTDFGEPGSPLLVTSTTPDVAAIYVAQLDALSGNTIWTQQIGGSAPVTAARVAADANGHIYVTGCFEESVSFDGGASTFDSPGGQDGFLSKWNTDGTLVWIDHFASVSGSVGGAALRLDAAGNPLLTFEFSGTVDFDPGPGTVSLTSTDAAIDTALIGVNQDGSLSWHRQASGPGTTKASGIVQDALGNVFVAGAFQSSVTLPTGHALSQPGNGMYLMKLAFGDPATKFYVVDDASSNQSFEYDAAGATNGSYSINSGNSAPRGASSTAVGDKVWVVDANRKVFVYDINGNLLGSWTAGTMASNATPEGIATNGTDVWIVDSKSDKVFKYTGAASRLSGSQNAASSFNLNSGNSNAKDIVTDGASLWVVNDSSTDKVFKYSTSGSLQGSWTMTGAGSQPTGITINPASVSNLWVVDSGTDRVYEFTAAASRTSGNQAAATSFALAAGNTNPQGIADPPASLAAQSEPQTIADAMRRLPTDASVASRRSESRVANSLVTRWRERDQVLETWNGTFQFDQRTNDHWCAPGPDGDSASSHESTDDSIATLDAAFESIFAKTL